MSGDPSTFIHGMVSLACFVVGFKFLKYWRVTSDRFFVWFAAAFWTFAIGWTLRAFVTTAGEHGYLVYVPRLLAFVMIIAAIIDKNRTTRG